MSSAEQRAYISERRREIEKWKQENEVSSVAKTLTNNDYVLFPREFFSGSEIFIIFGDTPIEDIAEMEFSMSQQAQPVFGYASFTWDALMTGSRFITGSFKINFKEAFYIQAVMDKLLNKQPDTSNLAKNVNIASTINELNSQIKNLSMDELRELAKAYEDKLWSKEKKIDKSNKTAWLDPFGGYDYLNDRSQWSSDYNHLLRNGFDIIIAYGEKISELKSDPSKIAEKGTVKTINGVHLTGYRTLYAPTGEPIFEEYTFIARDMDDSLYKDLNRGRPLKIINDKTSSYLPYSSDMPFLTHQMYDNQRVSSPQTYSPGMPFLTHQTMEFR